ncbi:MAG: hypothetical protein IJU57_01775 [Clostridia bacterium]|nr:hypothetical protein [Clostridia bacterium]
MLEKTYVGVSLTVNRRGDVRPRTIFWYDPEGEIRKYRVDRLKHVCRAASTKVGGCGMRYTVVVDGRETFLFEEDGRWFVEGRA